ncbi:MAG: RNA polymerase sigma-70 factor (ECF subfamily) [Moritella sp.]|jgi:RNA polymerase sigma-70 factor (ECF subfamily)
MQLHSVGIKPNMDIIHKDYTAENDNARLDTWLKKVANAQDKVAFSHLFHYFSPKIQAYGIKKFHNPTMAMELVQETMLLIWRKATLFNNSKGNAAGWVFTVMRNHCFDMLRKVQSNKEDTVSDELWPLFGDQIEEKQTDWLEINNLKRHLGALPRPQKQVVEGLYLRGLTQPELAEHLNVPIGTIKSRLRLALTKLKQEFTDEQN